MFHYDVVTQQSDPQMRIVWAHGWGHDANAMRELALPFAPHAENVLLDFPGFGKSPPPDTSWSTGDYADATREFLDTLKPMATTYWVGHSFGCRVGMQMAARHPGILSGMALIAAAGLQRRRGPVEQIKYLRRLWSYKIGARLLRFLGRDPKDLAMKYGSPDYRNAGSMRGVFVNVVREDLTEVARRITIPVKLIYGREDAETPVEMGLRLNQLIPRSELLVLDHQDHYSVLGEGRYPVIKAIQKLTGVDT